MSELNIQNSKMHYREWGSGGNTTILVLHGWGAASSQYETLGSLLGKKGFHVIAPDLPGFGAISPPPKIWGVGEYMEWVHEFIAKIREGGGSYNNKFILFGHSFGGRIAIKYADKYPNELQALILCASAGVKPPLTIKYVILRLLAIIGRIIFQFPGLNRASDFFKHILYHFVGSYDYFKAGRTMKEVMIKVIKEDITSVLSDIKIPTLLLWGTEDKLTPYKDGQTMQRLIPGAKLITFKNARHNLPKLIPEKLVQAIIQFLK